MSRSSESEAARRQRRGHWSARGQVEPTAALVATVVVCLGVGLYAVTLDSSIPSSDRDLAPPTLERVHTVLVTGGVVSPTRLDRALGAGPPGHDLNVTLRTADRRWTAGPTPPATADAATRRVGLEVTPGRVRSGILRVEVWP